MNEHEFLESLKKEVQNAELPFNEKDWEELRERLDGKKKRNVLPFFAAFPLSWRYVAGGAAAAVTLFFGLNYQPEDRNTIENTTVYKHAKPQILKDNQTDTDIENDVVFNIDATSQHEERTVPNAHTNTVERKLTYEKNTSGDLVITDSVKAVGENGEVPVIAKEQPEEKPVRQEIPKQDKAKENHLDTPIWEDLKTPDRQSVFFAGGGVNYGAQNVGYAIKLGLEKPISSRFSVHTALAVNTNNRHVTVTEIEKVTPYINLGNAPSYLSYDTTYKQANRDFAQAFAQALAGVDYRLYSKGKIGLSADAVRLLRSREAVNDFNKDLNTEKTSSLWNVGLRIQYTQQITPHFDIGTVYRQDVSGRINNTWENNFLQLMLIYKVGGTKK